MKTPEANQSGQIKLALNRKEAAAAIGVSAMTLDRLTRKKLLLASRATRRPLYALEELERFLRESSVEGSRKLSSISLAAGVNAPEQGEGQSNQNKRKTHGVKPGRVCPFRDVELLRAKPELCPQNLFYESKRIFTFKIRSYATPRRKRQNVAPFN